MKKRTADDEMSLTLDEVLMLAESLHKGASAMAETASDMMRLRDSSVTIPMSQIKEMLKSSLDLSINRFLDDLQAVRSAEMKKPVARKKVVKKKGAKK